MKEGSDAKASGFIPCYNNESTILKAIEGLRKQTIPLDEIFVVDDGSTDESVPLIKKAGIEVIEQSENSGRGAVRNKGMERAQHGLVLCCDATNSLEPDFLKKALPHFNDPKVCSVSGRITGGEPRTAVDRWRARHLFKEEVVFPESSRSEMLITYGTVMKRSAVLEVGNFNPGLRHTEDNELGRRLLQGGYQIWGNSTLAVLSLTSNTLPEVMERYWRWNAGEDEAFGWKNYWHDLKGSIRPMAMEDLAQRDWLSAWISLLSPHYRCWKTIKNKIVRKNP